MIKTDDQGVDGFELKHLFMMFYDKIFTELLVAEPGKIESFDPVKRTASVTVTNELQLIDGSFMSYPVINEVPVVIDGGGGFASTYPVKPGDLCLIVWQNGSLDEWSQGDNKPSSARRHSLTDCVAFVGTSPSSTSMDYDPDRAVFGNKGPRIACDGSAVHLGVDHLGVAIEDSIKGTTFSTAFDTFINTLATAVDPYSATVKAAAIAFQSAVVGGYTTSKVKVG